MRIAERGAIQVKQRCSFIGICRSSLLVSNAKEKGGKTLFPRNEKYSRPMSKAELKQRSVQKTAFNEEFTRQEPIPEEGIEMAVKLLRSGRLRRYNTGRGEKSDVSLLEKEFADYLGMKYCAALSSCGSAIYVALRCARVKPGSRVFHS